jgi:selenium metabolism protein YedF
MTDIKHIDCRGLACPQPVIETRDALKDAVSPFVVVVDNDASCTNVSRFAESQGARVTVSRQSTEFHVTIEPGRREPLGEPPTIQCSTTGGKNLVVYVSSEGMGSGDDALGAVLMAAFLDTLSHFERDVSHVIFVNAGAKLAVEGSPVLEQLRQLEQVGVKILVCGTCLNHFGVKDMLAVGSVSNMYAIIETLLKAGRIVRP